MAISAIDGVRIVPPSVLEGVLKDASSGMTTGHIAAWVLFGLIGMATFGYGRKQANFKAMIIGAVLMMYPYVVTDAIALWAVGFGLCGYLFFSRD